MASQPPLVKLRVPEDVFKTTFISVAVYPKTDMTNFYSTLLFYYHMAINWVIYSPSKSCYCLDLDSVCLEVLESDWVMVYCPEKYQMIKDRVLERYMNRRLKEHKKRIKMEQEAHYQRGIEWQRVCREYEEKMDELKIQENDMEMDLLALKSGSNHPEQVYINSLISHRIPLISPDQPCRVSYEAEYAILDSLSITRLKDMARNLGIRGYTKLSREGLMLNIKRRRQC